jgi:carboxyl-terminal processing protease
MRLFSMTRARTPLLSLAALGAAILLFLAAGCPPGLERTTPAYGDADREAYLASFDHVWTTIRDSHWDPDLGGIDWEGVRDELRPEIEATTSRKEARRVLNDLVGSLGLTHFAIMSGEAAAELEAAEGEDEDRGSGGESGIDVRVIDGQALVTRVEEGSGAATKGVRPGWVLVEVDGVPLASRLEKLAEAFEDSTLLDDTLVSAVRARLDGAPGSTCEVEFLDDEGGTRTAEIRRGTPRGKPTSFGNFPTTYVWIETRDLEDGQVGYVAFNYWLDPFRLMKVFEEAVVEFRDRRGIVIDLRGNPGGIGGMAMGMGGWLAGRTGLELGTMHLRDSSLRFYLNPRQGHYDGPVAILVDGLSASTSEIFAGGLKDIGRARLFGSHTAGAALPSLIEKLPTGEIFQYAIADYISAGGEHLEGVGVEPHVSLKPTRAELLAGRDSVLEAAVAWIGEQE